MIEEQLSEAELKIYRLMDQQTLSDYKEIFDIFDHDNDGKVCCKELGILMQALGENPSSKDLVAMIERFDYSKNGKIDFFGFVCIIAT